MSIHDYQEEEDEGAYDVDIGPQQGKGSENVRYQPASRPIHTTQQHTLQQQPRTMSSGNQYSSNPSAMQPNPFRQQQQQQLSQSQSFNPPVSQSSSQFQPGQQSPFQKQGIEYINNDSNKQSSQQQQHHSVSYNNPTSQFSTNKTSARPASQPFTRSPAALPHQQSNRPDIHSTSNTYRSGHHYDREADQVSGQMDEERLLVAQLRKQQDIVHNKMLEVSVPLVYISCI